jgi:hypothetical protein
LVFAETLAMVVPFWAVFRRFSGAYQLPGKLAQQTQRCLQCSRLYESMSLRATEKARKSPNGAELCKQTIDMERGSWYN